MSHTPGEWKVDTETGEIEAWMPNTQGPVIIGTIYGADDFPCCEEDITEECKANARLIAAAPALLEACKIALPRLEGSLRLARAVFGPPDKCPKCGRGDNPVLCAAHDELCVEQSEIDQLRAAVKLAEGG